MPIISGFRLTWISSSTLYTGWMSTHPGCHDMMDIHWCELNNRVGNFPPRQVSNRCTRDPKCIIECQGKCWTFIPFWEIVAAMSSRIFSKNMCWTKKPIQKKGQPQTLKATDQARRGMFTIVYQYSLYFTAALFWCWTRKNFPHLV